MEPENRITTRLLWAFLLLVIAGVTVAFLASRFGPAARARGLPVLGTIPDFSLTDRSGRTITRADLMGHVSVADFIFTSCSAQCPQVTAQMAKVQRFALPSWSDVRLLSLTVDPERDTPEVLSAYAQSFSADPDRWWFLTGPRDRLDDLTRNGFKVAGASPVPVDTSPDAILHSVSLVLLDRQARIRGYYQSTDSDDMARLRGDLSALASAGGPRLPLRRLPDLNAALNGASFLLLCCGYYFIRRKRIAAHRACMLTAFGTSVLFLVSYLAYHSQVGSVRFPGTGWVRPLYFSILISHTVLAAAVPILALITLFRAFRADFPAHKRIARWTLPIWTYVSLTGVVVYVMLYWVYGARG